MSAMSRVIDGAVGALAIVAGGLLALVTALLCLDVAVRYLQLASAPWIGDVASVSLFAITFLAAPWVLKEGRHVAVDVIVGRLRGRTGRLARQGVDALGAAICALLALYAVRVLLASIASGTMVYRMLVYPQWWLFALPPVTFALMALIFARQMLRRG